MRGRGVAIRWLFSDVPVLPASPDTVRIPASNVAENLFGVPIPIPMPTSLRRFAAEVRAADVVHIHDVMYMNSLVAVALSQRLDKPIVLTSHIWRVPYRNPLIAAIQSLAHRTIGEYCLRRASAIVTYNREIFGKLQRFGQEKTRFVANGIADAFLVAQEDITENRRQELRALSGFDAEDRIVLFAGRFVAKKGLDLVRAAAAQMPDTHFVLCGSGPIDPDSWQLANVRVIGALSQTELRDRFLSSDLLLLPSRGEGFPLVIPEAMACGLPCAILHETWAGLGENPELFELVDEARLVDQLRVLLRDSPDFTRRRQIAAFARGQWSWHAAVDQYLAIYNALCRSRQRQLQGVLSS